MFAVKGGSFFLGLFVVQCISHRVIRSPDKVEMELPNYSVERESGEYQEDMNEEAAYWQSQGNKIEDKESEGYDQLEGDREKTQDNYEKEKEHQQELQQDFNKEMNDTYHEDRDKTEAQQQANQEHYQGYSNDVNFEHQGNQTAEEFSETGDRYEEKGSEYTNKGEDNMQNYNVTGDAPSIIYTRT